jgi:hypothetical protein
MQYEISFRDIFYNLESPEEAYESLLQYLTECVRNQDVTAFAVEERVEREDPIKVLKRLQTLPKQP